MKNDAFSLKGRNVYAVGGSGLLGLAACQAMARAGAKVIVLDLSKPKASAKGLLYEYFDVCDMDGCESTFQRLVKKYGAMHVLVNFSFPRSRDWGIPFEKMTVSYLRENVEKHFNSCLWTSRAAALLMQKTKIKGSIINFGSIYGMRACDFSVYEGTNMSSDFTYSGVKAGIVNATRFLASYFGKQGIRVNCVCPGGIFDHQNSVFVKNYIRQTPLKRMGTPEDVANAVVFLAGDASSYITGTALMVDGGWTAV